MTPLESAIVRDVVARSRIARTHDRQRLAFANQRVDWWQERAIASDARAAALAAHVGRLEDELAETRRRTVRLEDELLRIADRRRHP